MIEKWTAVVGYSDWMEHLPRFTKQPFRDACAYRVRPEPNREIVNLYDVCISEWSDSKPPDAEYRITFDRVDGEPDTSSIKMEKL